MGRRRDTALVQPHEKFFVQAVEVRLRESGNAIAETHDVERHRCHQFELGACWDERGKVVRLCNVLVDEAPEFLESVFLEREPHFKRTKPRESCRP